jgi:hypothetical protein
MAHPAVRLFAVSERELLAHWHPKYEQKAGIVCFARIVDTAKAVALLQFPSRLFASAVLITSALFSESDGRGCLRRDLQ